MITKHIKLKLNLQSVKQYEGGANQLLNDIKDAGVILHNDSNGYYITSQSASKFSATTDYAEKLNQLKIITVFSPNNLEIAKLKILFLDSETESSYFIPDKSTIEGESINLTFNVYTLSFVNTEYPQFSVELPEPVTVPQGTSVTLPSVFKEYEESGKFYTSSSWDIGTFGESVIINKDIITNLVWYISNPSLFFVIDSEIGNVLNGGNLTFKNQELQPVILPTSILEFDHV